MPKLILPCCEPLLAKLAALVPARRVHLTRFHGVLAPAAKWRPWIVPKPSVELDVPSAAVPISLPGSAPGNNDPTEAKGSTKEMPPRRNYAWAYLIWAARRRICNRAFSREARTRPSHE